MSLFQIDAGREWRGGQRQALFLARELRKKGYPFQLVVQPGSPLFEKASAENLPVFPLRIKSESHFAAAFKLSRAMRRHGCLLAHFHDAHGAAVGSVASNWAKVPIRVISRRVDFPLKKNLLSRNKYRKNVDVIIAISEGVKDVLLQGGIAPEVIEVVPSGIDFSPFDEIKSKDFLRREFSFAQDDFLVGIVAQLEDHKGHKYLIEAAKILKERTSNIKIVIVGKGSLELELDQQARDLHVDDLVYFLGFREDVPQIMASLDLFVLSSYLEGLGTSIMDAMASRLPIVATAVGGIPEIVINNQTGILVPARNPQALAEAILKLYHDREFGRRLAQKGYDIVHQKFSAESMADRVIDVYEKIARRKGLRLHGKR